MTVEYLDLNKPPMAGVAFPLVGFRGFSWSMVKNSSRVILLSAVLAPDEFTFAAFEDAEEEERAKLEIPDEILERTEAHDLRLADFVEGVVEDAREGDLSRR